MDECELTLLPKDQCGGKCCRPDLNEQPKEPSNLNELFTQIIERYS
jgi:hypothetical protein